MFRRELEPLSSEARELLAKERQYPPEPNRLRARALLKARVSAFQASTERPPLLRRPASLLLAAAPVVVFAALAFASFRAWRSASPSAAVPPGESARTSSFSAPRAPATLPSSTPSASREPLARPGAPGLLEANPPATKRRANPAVEAESAELRLLQRARAAVANREFATALDLIAEYQRRFPTGLLREECEALRIKSLSGLGKNEQARRAADGFREHFPRSVLLRRIEETAKQPR